MPYTQENFFQENYPQWHQKVVFAEQKGWLEGKVEMARAFKQRGYRYRDNCGDFRYSYRAGEDAVTRDLSARSAF